VLVYRLYQRLTIAVKARQAAALLTLRSSVAIPRISGTVSTRTPCAGSSIAWTSAWII